MNKYRIGLDLGSTAAKAALVGSDGTVADLLLDVSGDAPDRVALRLAAALRDKHGLPDVDAVATGYGRALAGLAAKKITEITCHARGVRHLHPDAATILDIGGQDAKTIRLGADGGVEDFAMNDRCAAGTGSFLEVAARRYKVDIAGLSAFCGHDSGPDADTPPFEISSTCVVFAESELIGLNARGTPPREALRAVHRAIAKRVTLLLKQVSAREPLYFTGGVARNDTLRHAIRAASGLEIRLADNAQYTGAIGAALFA